MNTTIYSATTIGIDAHLVEVEVDLSFGMLNFYIVGLPDTAIRESTKRILKALKNSGIKIPERTITVNLAPADLKKEGTVFDLPITVGILQANKTISVSQQFINETLILGELGLDGTIRRIKGALAIASDAKKLGKKRIILPSVNKEEANLIEDIEVIGVQSLVELIAYMRGEILIQPAQPIHSLPDNHQIENLIDFSQVKGQYQAKRALQIAAAGRHNILFIGSPGSGKTMLAKRLPTIMPKMDFEQTLATTKIYSISGKLGNQSLITERAFRSPHHTISQAGLVGGGSFPQPGEISLAHNGILFLDELTEFKRTTLEVMRQPMENKSVCIARAAQTVNFPADFLLVAALNPCPCGFLGDSKRECSCTHHQISRYLDKLSGPLLDRIDLQIHVQSVEYDTIKDKTQDSVGSYDLYQKVKAAVEMQQQRFGTSSISNSTMRPEHIDQFCILTQSAEQLIRKAFDKLALSMRGYHKTLKVARTIADLGGSDIIDITHVQEALTYRSLDQTFDRTRLSTDKLS
jgi:magnesium chelatase family protein